MLSKELEEILVEKGVDYQNIDVIRDHIKMIKEGKYHEQKSQYARRPDVERVARRKPELLRAIGELARLSKVNSEAHRLTKLIAGDGWTFLKVLPPEWTIKPEFRLPTLDMALNYVRKARSWSFKDYCPCRYAYKGSSHQKCNVPEHIGCINMNEMADRAEELGYGKIATLEEVEERIQDGFKMGLRVMLSYYWYYETKELKYSTVGLCDDCCCIPFVTWKNSPNDIRRSVIKPADFTAVIDYKHCDSGCTKCMEKCFFEAIKMGAKRKVVVDNHKCHGCGQCTLYCPNNAIALELWRRN